ncbi:DUF4157 domain-containing protein [Streptomyces sp. NPDC048659]|uniref:eCIS core domain-containing protein n=1 Tax=Streptomyces sp. NPDC048659 TaxID=3155489 RepID=UPI003422B906
MRARAEGRGGTSGERAVGETRAGRAATPARARGRGGAGTSAGPLDAAALQGLIGNAAVARAVQRAREREEEQGGGALVHEELRRPGRPLGQALRAEMEARLGADFSDVRVHTGATAQRSAAVIGARAYTSGRDVVIGSGGGDRHTLAHELTHVVQQREGPVAGTDDGTGLALSDPSDSYERAAEANARRVMSGGPPPVTTQAAPARHAEHGSGGSADTAPAQRAAAPVQRMLGFETEVSLPVEDAAGNQFEGDTDLAKSTREDFKVVSDKRSLNSGAGYSNIEFVTGAVRVVGSQAEAGKGRLDQLADEIRAVSDRFYQETERTPLADLPLELEILPGGAEARLAPDLDYPEYAGQQGFGDGLFVHYSVGVPLKGMPLFFDHLRTAAPDTQGAPNRRARFRLTQAKAFAKAVVDMYDLADSTDKKRKEHDEDTDALNGYCQLFFTQVAAVADYVAEDQDQGQIKNLTAVLSRSRLSDVHALLKAEFRTFLTDRDEEILTLLAGYQEDSGDGRTLEFQEDSTRDIEDGPVSLYDFAMSAIRGVPHVFQQRVFGGMNQIDPHQEEGAVMVPFEIRTMGSLMKTWDELKNELRSLADWAEEAYRHDRGPGPAEGEPQRTRSRRNGRGGGEGSGSGRTRK